MIIGSGVCMFVVVRCIVSWGSVWCLCWISVVVSLCCGMWMVRFVLRC